MKKCCIAVLSLIIITGCTANIRMTDINFESGRDMMVDGSGATNTTDTGQLASADMQALLDAVKTALSAKKVSIIDTIKNAISGDDTGAAVSPAGTIEEVE